MLSAVLGRVQSAVKSEGSSASTQATGRAELEQYSRCIPEHSRAQSSSLIELPCAINAQLSHSIQYNQFVQELLEGAVTRSKHDQSP